MKIIACVDDNMGLLFNNRRQSRDSKVIEKIFEIVGTSELYINEFSQKLFLGNCNVASDFLDIAGADDYCFVENVDISTYGKKIQEIYLFKWNRKYPYDFTFAIDPQVDFTLKHSEDIIGSSHEKITMEVWEK